LFFFFFVGVGVLSGDVCHVTGSVAAVVPEGRLRMCDVLSNVILEDISGTLKDDMYVKVDFLYVR
jgi:hypothetical protein